MEVKLSLSTSQRKKLEAAATAGTGCTLVLPKDAYDGDITLILPERTVTKIKKHAEKGTGIRLELSATAVAANKKTIGGWLPLVAGLAGTILPGLVSSLFGSNDSEGDGLSLHGSQPVPGRGMTPHGTPPPPPIGRGMFLHGSQSQSKYAGIRKPVIHAAPPEIAETPLAEPAKTGEGVKKKPRKRAIHPLATST